MKAMSNSAVVRAKLEIMGAGLQAAFVRFREQPDQARLFPRLLLHLHQIMRASVPILTAARDYARAQAAADPVCAGLVGYLEEHIEEERDHDAWMLADLGAAGVSAAAALAEIPSPNVAAAAGAQYYWIHHHHPAAVLGYIAVLEGTPPSAALLDEYEARSGLPATAFRTLRKHGQLDPLHGRDLDRLLDDLPLSPAHAKLVGLSIAHTASSLARSVDELIAAA